MFVFSSSIFVFFILDAHIIGEMYLEMLPSISREKNIMYFCIYIKERYVEKNNRKRLVYSLKYTEKR